MQYYSEGMIRYGDIEIQVTDLNFKADRSKSLLETGVLAGELTCVLRTFESSVTIPVSKRQVRKLFSVLDPSRIARTLWHVERGCGPGGRRNSKVSRRIASALRRASSCPI